MSNAHPRGTRVRLTGDAIGVVVGSGTRVTSTGQRVATNRCLWPLGSLEQRASFEGRGSSWHDADALDALTLAGIA